MQIKNLPLHYQKLQTFKVYFGGLIMVASKTPNMLVCSSPLLR